MTRLCYLFSDNTFLLRNGRAVTGDATRTPDSVFKLLQRQSHIGLWMPKQDRSNTVYGFLSGITTSRSPQQAEVKLQAEVHNKENFKTVKSHTTDRSPQQVEVTQQAEVYSRQKHRSRNRQKTKEFQEPFSVQICFSESLACDAQPITAERRNNCTIKCVINCKR
ncbi:hypothetical protein AVEN_175872-1 [Araneus ventricosus]|uniref:Uncharacterized protein n=1 Tax=Araneus ventricosus TaxID=182803 RepID=A0A4Y2RF00_ARAVE|nr:hypothetical protein AVEN_175872-1 [Araneus ventricosus]